MQLIKYICSALALCYSMIACASDQIVTVTDATTTKQQEMDAFYYKWLCNIDREVVNYKSNIDKITNQMRYEEQPSSKRLLYWKDSLEDLSKRYSNINDELNMIDTRAKSVLTNATESIVLTTIPESITSLKSAYDKIPVLLKTLEQMEQEERAKPTITDLIMVLKEISGSLKDLRDHLLPKDDKAADSSSEQE